MNLEQILNYRRSIRYYSDTKLVDTEKVAHCLRLAQLAPTSSNMQLYEMYHITDKDVLKKLASACLEQNSADTAQEMVVFVTRQDLHRKREREVFRLEIENIRRTKPCGKTRKTHKKVENVLRKASSDSLHSFFWNFRNSPKNNGTGNWALSPYDEAGFGGGYACSGA